MPGEKILDLAAGTGTSTQPFYLAGADPIACDFSSGMIEVGRKQYPHLTFVQGDALNLPFEDNTFDEIYAYNILEYLASQGNTTFFYEEFDEYHRIIKPNGILHIIVPEINKPAAWADPGITRVLPPSVFKFLENTWKLVISRSIGEHMYIKLQAI